MKGARHPFQLVLSLDEDVLPCVDQYIVHSRVAEQRRERSETEDLVEHVTNNRVALVVRDLGSRLGYERENNCANFAFGLLAGRGSQSFKVEPGQ